MSSVSYETANSRTKIEYDPTWRVLDLGSGHNPHTRANIIVDRYIEDIDGIAGRSGRGLALTDHQTLVIADACALPFKAQAFDFVICSHIAEHIEEIDKFCSEVNRIGQRGYIETPSKLAEYLRHPPYHLWYVSRRHDELIFERAQPSYPLGWFGKMFFSIYFYSGAQLQGKDVYSFAYGMPEPFHSILLLIRRALNRLWLSLKPVMYTRMLWQQGFRWRVVSATQDVLIL